MLNSKGNMLYFRREFAQSTYSVELVKTQDGRLKPNTSINSEKIADAARLHLQTNPDYEDFKYDRLFPVAQEELSETFEKLGLNSPKSKNEEKSFERKERIAISNWIEAKIDREFEKRIRVDFDTFVSSLGIKMATTSTNNALKTFVDAQNKNVYHVKRQELDLESGEILTGLSEVMALPVITLWLKEGLEKEVMSIQDFLDLKMKNKKQYIKALELELSTAYLFHVLGVGNAYIKTSHKARKNFSHAVSFNMDIFLHTLRRGRGRVSVATLREVLGAKETTAYKYFKRDSLMKAIRDIEANMNKKITIKEEKIGNKVEYILFTVTEGSGADGSSQESFFGHYVASQLFYFSDIEIKDVDKFASHVASLSASEEKDTLHGGKLLSEWEEEAEESFLAEQEICELLIEDEIFFAHFSLIYSKNRHTLMQRKVVFEEGEEKESFSLVRDKNKKTITNPVDSLLHIRELQKDLFRRKVFLLDFIPFGYATVGGKWENINNMEMFVKYQNSMQKDILLHNVENFSIADETKKMYLDYCIRKNLLAETSSGLKKVIQKTLFD